MINFGAETLNLRIAKGDTITTPLVGSDTMINLSLGLLSSSVLYGRTFSPGALFAANEAGVWYDPSDFSTMFQDSAGTTPVTAVEQPVGLILDKSKGLAETVLYSTDFSTSTGWSLTNATISGGALNLSPSASCSRSAALTVGALYRLTYTITAISPGTGNIKFFVGSTGAGVARTTTGTFTEYVFCSGALAIYVFTGAGFVSGSVDDLTITKIDGNHASQSTAASRPVLSARVNLLSFTEQSDNAAWTKNAATVSANAVAAPDGTTTADKIVETATTNHHGVYVGFTAAAGQSFSISLKAAERTYAQIYDPGNGRFGLFVVDLSNGTIAQNSTSLVASITSQGNGWYRVTVQPTASANFVGVALLNTSTASSAFGSSYAGDGTSGLYAWGADLRFINAGVNLPAYQRVAASTDYDTTGFPLYLKFDGVDDSLATGTITPGVDKAQVFAGVRKLSDAATGFVVELSTSVLANNGTFFIRAPNGAAANYYAETKGTSSVASGTVTSFAAPISNVVTLIGDISAPLATLRVNGTQESSSNLSQGTGNYLAYPLYIGRRAGTTNPYNGNLYSLIARFGANLTAAQIASTEAWVNSKTRAY